MNTGLVLAYLLTWFVVALTPGPAVFNAMAQASRFGFRSSLAGIAGTQLGNLMFFVCVALGFSAFLSVTGDAFRWLRIGGAVYLVYLGARTIAAATRRTTAGSDRQVQPLVPRRRLVLQGLLIQLTNPKALLFVSALLPQFIDARFPASEQFVVLFLVTALVDFLVLGSYAWLAARGAQSFRESTLSRWWRGMFGAALVLFGCRLLLSRK